MGKHFRVKKGIKQGDPLSSLIFISALGEVFRNLNWEKKGLPINGEKINNLRFADDVVLISTNLEEFKIKRGRKKSWTKNESKQIQDIILRREYRNRNQSQKSIDRERDNIFRTTDSLHNGTTEEIDRRITLGWNKFWSLKNTSRGAILEPSQESNIQQLYNTYTHCHMVLKHGHLLKKMEIDYE